MGGETSSIWQAIATAAAIQLSLLAAWLLARERPFGVSWALRTQRERLVLGLPCLAVAATAGAWLASRLDRIGLSEGVELALLAALLACALAVAVRAGARSSRDRRFRELFDNAPLGIVACDMTGQVRVANAPMWRMLGARRPLPARRLGNLLTNPVGVRTGSAALTRRALERGETLVSEASYTSRCLGVRNVRVLAGPLRESGGEIAGALLLVEDVTERGAVQRHIRQGQDLEAMSRLAALIAHEVNDPLACVRANLTAMREELRAIEADGPTRAAELGRILDESRDGVERAIALVRDLQEGAQARVSDEPADSTSLTPLLRGCVRIAAAHSKTGLLIEEQYADVCPVRASANALRPVFIHLLVNAVEAAGARGQVRICTRHEDGHAVVRVSDNGPGVPRENSARIFEPFFTTKASGASAGLGLYLAREIVRSHRGEIRVHANSGPGATFEVRLPLAAGPNGGERQGS